MTALRVMPPSSAAIWLAESPSAHSFFKSSTRSSVQLIGLFSIGDQPLRWNPIPVAGPGSGPDPTRQQ